MPLTNLHKVHQRSIDPAAYAASLRQQAYAIMVYCLDPCLHDYLRKA